MKNSKRSVVKTKSAAETQAVAQKFAKTLRGGEVIALSGDLGAGKTTFAQGLAAGLGVKGTVTSPTFVFMNVYPAHHGQVREFVHVDWYRLKKESDATTIGIGEYMGARETVVAIEWPERIETLVPDDAIRISIQNASD